MRRIRQASRIPGGVLLAGLALAASGCSGSDGGHTATKAPSASTGAAAPAASEAPTTSTGASVPESSNEPVVSLSLSSSIGLEPIAARYTCDGADVSPPISWGTIPAGTVELALFVVNQERVNGRVFVDWALTGLRPSLRQLSAGQTPAGAVVGRNSFGQTAYSVCPARGAPTEYVVRLDAVSKRLGVRTGFDASALFRPASHASNSIGLLSFSYQRR
jgi:phosphatidylethanolamine-binding protein (PEBP) family uncharacterized protein